MYLRGHVSSKCSSSSEGGEESGYPCNFNGMSHPQLQISELYSLSECVDKYEDVVDPCEDSKNDGTFRK